MAFLTTDYSKNTSGDYSPIPQGEYEMVIAAAHEDATKSGAEYLDIQFTVRNDLDAALPETNGKYHNRHVWMPNWKRKATGLYDMNQLQYVLEAVGVPEGTPIDTIQDFCSVLYHKPVKVYVKVQHDEYDDTDKNTVAPWSVKPTDYPKLAHTFKEAKDKPAAKHSAPAVNQGPTNINDDDLPF
ncbi:DUF669 domain-containing protein [Schleiferilactobacillus harbinensis]|uniref:DUF669 domain-containing protein n=1 Tax=Schleiferilactobacillus harbinensis TaxID=304207 RepID=A0A5P8M5G1_9LACO|nr:DUF669 domain-containing protein [Schleiferilactobacillus harbinensis]QFR23723.1 DUF669 domain-containing protein [Schleiferilactobacillus harbinensis]